MLKYLYTLDYDDNGEAASLARYTHDKGADLQATTGTEEQQLSAHDPSDYPELLNNIAVYAIADKYDIPELEVLAATKFATRLWSDLPGDLASLPAIIDAVFDTTPDTKCGLRNVVIQYCKYWKERIVDNEDSLAIVRDHGEIALAMIRQIITEHDELFKETRVRKTMWKWHIERISRAAKCMKVSDSREVQQSYIDAQHRRFKVLRDAIHQAKDYFNEE